MGLTKRQTVILKMIYKAFPHAHDPDDTFTVNAHNRSTRIHLMASEDAPKILEMPDLLKALPNVPKPDLHRDLTILRYAGFMAWIYETDFTQQPDRFQITQKGIEYLQSNRKRLKALATWAATTILSAGTITLILKLFKVIQ